MKNIRLVLFDIDGTLLDTREFIYQAFEHVSKKYKLAALQREKMEKFMGQPLEKCYNTFYPNEDAVKLCQAHRLFQLNNLDLAVVFPHTLEVLRQLNEKGIKIAAVTSRWRETLMETLELTGITSYFDMIVTSDDVKNHKPHPEALLKVLEKFRINPENAVMIGDTEPDILAGKKAGVFTIGVTYGFHGKDIKNAQPDFVVDDILEVIPLIIKPTNIISNYL